MEGDRMAQIINTPSRTAYAGQATGSALGQSLEKLAGNFVGEFTRGKQRTEFEKHYPGYGDVIAQFHAKPELQQKLIMGLNKQKAVQQQAMMEALSNSEEGLYAQGYPREVAREIAAQQDPKARDFLRKNYLKAQSEPATAWDNLVSGVSRQLGIQSSKVPKLFEEQQRDQQMQQQQNGQGSQEQQQSSNPVGTLSSSLGNLFTKPGLALTGMAEGLGGLPGALASLPSTLINLIPNALGKGNLMTPYGEIGEEQEKRINEFAESLGLPEEGARIFKGIGKSSIAPKLPTSSDIREKVTKPLAKATGTEKHFIPQTEKEEAFTNVFQEAAPEVAQALATGGFLPILKGVAKGVARSLGANAAGWLAQDITGSELAGTVVKMGTYIGSSFVPGMLKKTVNKNYGEWRDALEKAPNKQVAVSHVDKELQEVQKAVNNLPHNSPAAKFMRDRLEELEMKFHYNPKGKQFVNADALSELRFGQNKLYRTAVKDGAVKPFEKLLNAEKDLLGSWAKQNGASDAFKSFTNANEIYSGLQKAGDLRSFLKGVSRMRSLLFSSAIILGPIGWGAKSAIGAAYASKSLASHVINLLKVPAIRAEYTKVLKAAASGNAKVAALAAERLEKKAQKLDPKMTKILYKK